MPNPNLTRIIVGTLSLGAAAAHAAPWEGEASPTGTLLLILGVLAILLGMRNWQALRQKPTSTKRTDSDSRSTAEQRSDA